MFTFTKAQKKLLGKFYANHLHPANCQNEKAELDRRLDEFFDEGNEELNRKLLKYVWMIERIDLLNLKYQPELKKGLVNYWRRSGMEHWREIFIFDTSENADAMMKYLDYEGVPLEGSRRDVPPGHAFQYPAHIGQLTETRFLVEMSGGLNV